MLTWGLLGIAAAGAWTVDGTSLDEHRGTAPVASSVTCPAPSPDAPRLRGMALTVLGVAVVAYSKKQGTMTWGHASLRATYCLGSALHDVEYEAYRLSAWNEAQLRGEHAGETFAEEERLARRGDHVLFRNQNPVDGGWYAEAQAANREIYEVWLDLPQAELDTVVLRAEAAWEAQRARLRADVSLDRRFDWIGDNCTSVFSDFLPAELDVGAPITPFAWVRRLESRARAQILYPSHHLVNRWRGVLPTEVRRLRPVFRRRSRIHRRWLPSLRASLQGAQPALTFVVPSAGIATSP